MKKHLPVLFFLLLVFVGATRGISALTRDELAKQFGQLELRAEALEEKIQQVEKGSTQWEKRDLLAELSIIQGEVARMQTVLATAVTPPACIYTYEPTSPCQPNGTRPQKVTSALPTGCTGTPAPTQSCTYTTPTVVNPGGTGVDPRSSGGLTTATIGGGVTPVTGGQTRNQGDQTGGTPPGTGDTVGNGTGVTPGGDSSRVSGETGEVTGPTITTLLGRARGVLDALIPFIIGLAVFVILWGIFTYITKAAEEEKRAEAKRFIIYGLLGVFFMISIWGFVTILINTFSVEQRINSGDIPTVPEIVPTTP